MLDLVKQLGGTKTVSCGHGMSTLHEQGAQVDGRLIARDRYGLPFALVGILLSLHVHGDHLVE